MERVFDSRVGSACVVVYTLFAIGSYAYALGCGTETCSVAIVWPILPWAFILVNDLGLKFPAAMYPVFILFNVSVAYVLGATAEWVYHAMQARFGSKDRTVSSAPKKGRPTLSK